MSRHVFLRQLAEELRDVYKEKCESMVPKHNEEEQSQDKRKASKRYHCQVGMCKRNKTTKKCEICFKYIRGNCTKTVEKKFYCKKLREVYKEKCESVVPKHNEEKQSQDKGKASKRHHCQVCMCKRNKTTKNVKYVSNIYVEITRN